jgi:hypothetical protein
MKMKTEGEVMLPYSRACQQLPASYQELGESPPKSSERTSPAYTWILDF